MAQIGEKRSININGKWRRRTYGYNPSTGKFAWYSRKGIYSRGIITSEREYAPFRDIVKRNRASALRKNIVDTVRLRSSNTIYNQKLGDAFEEALNKMSDDEIQTFSEEYYNLIQAYFKYESEAPAGSVEMDGRIALLGEVLGINVNDSEFTYMNPMRYNEKYENDLIGNEMKFQIKVNLYDKDMS